MSYLMSFILCVLSDSYIVQASKENLCFPSSHRHKVQRTSHSRSHHGSQMERHTASVPSQENRSPAHEVRTHAHLLILTVCQNPVFLLWVEQQALDVKVQPVLLIGGAFIRADQQAALNLWVREQHNLQQRILGKKTTGSWSYKWTELQKEEKIWQEGRQTILSQTRTLILSCYGALDQCPKSSSPRRGEFSRSG